MKAIWKNTLIAESDDIKMIEGNAYFPFSSLNESLVEESDTTSTCPWKGEARYLNLVVEGEKNKDAAWYYPEPKKEASAVQNRVAFWKGVQITE